MNRQCVHTHTHARTHARTHAHAHAHAHTRGIHSSDSVVGVICNKPFAHGLKCPNRNIPHIYVFVKLNFAESFQVKRTCSIQHTGSRKQYVDSLSVECLIFERIYTPQRVPNVRIRLLVFFGDIFGVGGGYIVKTVFQISHGGK